MHGVNNGMIVKAIKQAGKGLLDAVDVGADEGEVRCGGVGLQHAAATGRLTADGIIQIIDNLDVAAHAR